MALINAEISCVRSRDQFFSVCAWRLHALRYCATGLKIILSASVLEVYCSDSYSHCKTTQLNPRPSMRNPRAQGLTIALPIADRWPQRICWSRIHQNNCMLTVQHGSADWVFTLRPSFPACLLRGECDITSGTPNLCAKKSQVYCTTVLANRALFLDFSLNRAYDITCGTDRTSAEVRSALANFLFRLLAYIFSTSGAHCVS